MPGKRRYGTTPIISDQILKDFFAQDSTVSVAILFGSRALGRAHEQSDYDFAVIFAHFSTDGWGLLANLRSEIYEKLKLPDEDFDVVDLKDADNAVLSGIAEGYVLLKGDECEIRKIFRKDQGKC